MSFNSPELLLISVFKILDSKKKLNPEIQLFYIVNDSYPDASR